MLTSDKNGAYKFIFLMGLVSLLADFTYEGAKGIIGPYLAHLGASALLISVISGLSELAGYWTRLFSGFVSDRFKSFWGITLLGYALNLFSVPLLGFVKGWQLAGFLVFLERFGKGLRTPTRDVLLSRATAFVGHGKGFGIHEFLDQVGAVLGPMFVGFMLFMGLGYKTAFLSLFVPAFLALLLLFLAKKHYGYISDKEKERTQTANFNKNLYFYLFASCLVSLSFLQFPLVGFHLSQHQHLEEWKVALLFALAMGVDALSALIFGILYDRIGFLALSVGLIFGMLSPLFLFMFDQPILAMVLWGISLGVQESIMRSGVARLSSESSRGRAYGLFHFFFGLSAFLGGVLMGVLYETSKEILVLYSLALHLIAIGVITRLKL